MGLIWGWGFRGGGGWGETLSWEERGTFEGSEKREVP